MPHTGSVAMAPPVTVLASYHRCSAAPSFLAASPAGTATFPNDAASLGWLRSVRDANVAAGLLSMDVDATREVALGAAFALVTVTWVATFRSTGDRPIRFDVPKVLAFVSHDDQDEVMRREGIGRP